MIKCFLQAKEGNVQRLVSCVILLYLAYIENCINNAMTLNKAALHLVDLNSLYAKIPSSFPYQLQLVVVASVQSIQFAYVQIDNVALM